MRVAATNGSRGPGQAGRRRRGPRGRPSAAVGCLGMRRIERPVGGPGAGHADRPAEQPQQRPPERHEPGFHDRRRGRQVVGRRQDRARASRSATRRPPVAQLRRRGAADAMRAAPPTARAPSSQARKAAGVEIPHDGVTSSSPGRSWARRRHAARAAGRCALRVPRPAPGHPARKNGTSEPSSAASRSARLGTEGRRPTPRAPRRRAAAASDEPPASPAATGIRFSRRAARGGGGSGRPHSGRGGAAGGRDGAQDEVVGDGPGVVAGRRGACRRRPGGGDRDRRGGPRGRGGPSRCGGRGNRPAGFPAPRG